MFVQERGVEGIHARVSQALAGRRRKLSAPGISLELKWQFIEQTLHSSPKAGVVVGISN